MPANIEETERGSTSDLIRFPSAIQDLIRSTTKGRLALVHPGRVGLDAAGKQYRWFGLVFPSWHPPVLDKALLRRAERCSWEVLHWPSFFGTFSIIIGHDLAVDAELNLPSITGMLTLDRAADLGLGEDWEPNPPALISVKSGNPKTGPISNTFSSQAGCSTACEHFHNGCYTEHGTSWFVTRRVNASPVRDPLEIAKAEAALIDKLPGDVDLRLNEVGDCATEEGARHRSSSCVRMEQRSPNGSKAFGYTHAWRTVPVEAHQGISILASCESAEDVKLAHARGYATAIVVPEFKSEKAYEIDGIRILPCPNETRGIQCIKCRLCMQAGHLRERGLTIGFTPHGSGQKSIRATIQAKR